MGEEWVLGISGVFELRRNVLNSRHIGGSTLSGQGGPVPRSIFRSMKTSGLLTNMQSRFSSLDLDGVLQQPTPVTIRLQVSFYLCSSRSKVERQRLRSLEGCRVSSKSPSRAGDQDEGVSGGNGREMYFLTPISVLPYI